MKRWLGIDGVDFAIQAGITLCLAIGLSSLARQNEEIVIFSVFAGSLGLLAWRRYQAKRRGELGSSSGQHTLDYSHELEQRVSELESMQQRMYELEERVDFAERLLLKSERRPEQLS